MKNQSTRWFPIINGNNYPRIPEDWEAAFRTSDVITTNVPGAVMSLPPKPKLSVVVVQPEFPNFEKGENWQISNTSGGIVFPIKKTPHSIKFFTDPETLSPAFYRLAAVHTGQFKVTFSNKNVMAQGGDRFIGFDVQKWIFAPLQFIAGLWNDFTINKIIDKLELADANGMPIDYGKTPSHFKKAVANAVKHVHTYSDEFVKVMSDDRALKATGEPAVGLYYLEGSEYHQWGGSEIPVQMYPPGCYNKFGILSKPERDLVFASRELFTCFNPEYVNFFKDVTYECQLNCRMLACYNPDSKCCYKTNCCGVCASPLCCYTRECFNAPHELDLLLTEWGDTLVEAVRTNQSINLISEIFAKTDGQYPDIDKIKEKLGLSFNTTFIERNYTLSVNKTKEEIARLSDEDFELETSIITNFHKLLEGMAYKQAVMAAFAKFRHRNRNMEMEGIFDGWQLSIDFGKRSSEFIANMKRRQIQNQAQDRVKLLYNKTEDAWHAKQGLPPIRRTPLTIEEVKASFVEIDKSASKKSASKKSASKKHKKSKRKLEKK